MTFESDGGNFSDVRETIKFFDDAFDHSAAQKDGEITPGPGVDEGYDAAMKHLQVGLTRGRVNSINPNKAGGKVCPP